MIRKSLFLILLLLFINNVQAAFSIVADDPVTGEIGIVKTTCVDQEYGAKIINDIFDPIDELHTHYDAHPINGKCPSEFIFQNGFKIQIPD